MRQVQCFQAVDGQLFEEEQDARAHEDDLLGTALDDLLRVEHTLTREQEKGLLELWLRDRATLARKVAAVQRLLARIQDEEQNP